MDFFRELAEHLRDKFTVLQTAPSMEKILVDHRDRMYVIQVTEVPRDVGVRLASIMHTLGEQ